MRGWIIAVVLGWALGVSPHAKAQPATAEEEAGIGGQTILSLSAESLPGLLEEGFDIKTAVSGYLVLQRADKSLPVYLCEVQPVIARRTTMNDRDRPLTPPASISVKGCYELPAARE